MVDRDDVDRHNCGNFERLKAAVETSKPAPAECLNLCGAVRDDCLSAIHNPEFEEIPDEMKKAADGVRDFLEMGINPFLISLKERMALYAISINDSIHAGIQVPKPILALYSTGFDDLKKILGMMESESNKMAGNIFYQGLLRMLVHRVKGEMTTIMGLGGLYIYALERGKAPKSGTFIDRFATFQDFALTKSELELQNWPPCSLAESAITEVERQFRIDKVDNVKLIRDFPEGSSSPEIGFIKAHQKIFDEVLRELMKNSLRALPDQGGEITISVKVVNGHVVFSVKDNGSGISPEVLPRIFENKFTTRAEQGGTGQGLHLVKMYIDHLGGSISVESTPGKGSEFSISLPLAKE